MCFWNTKFWPCFLVFLLCQCATQERFQPVAFPPSFPLTPSSYLSQAMVVELRDLEERAVSFLDSSPLSLLEKKRLLELYQIEIRSLKPKHPRFQFIQDKIKILMPQMEELERELREYRDQIKRDQETENSSLVIEEPSHTVFTHANFKKQYLLILRLWNQGHTIQAAAYLEKILQDTANRKLVSDKEWSKFLLLHIRFLIELEQTEEMGKEVLALQSISSCSADSAQGGFLVAMYLLGKKKFVSAKKIFSSLCDPDESVSNQIRLSYWKTRFQNIGIEEEPSSPIPDLQARQKQLPRVSRKIATQLEQIRHYESLVLGNARFPGIYAYLSRYHLQENLHFLSSYFTPLNFENSNLLVSREIKEMIEKAQERLKANLKKDASVYLKRSAQILISDLNPENIESLFYIAHLMHAAGHSLEAMKIYSAINNTFQQKPDLGAEGLRYLGEIFPKPYENIVEHLCSEWGVDSSLVYAIMRQESAFNPNAMSHANARGLMQLIPRLAKSIAVSWNYENFYSDRLLFYSKENLKFSIYHLSKLQALLPHLVLQIAAYNAGVERVLGWWKRWGGFPIDVFIELIPISETRNYVKLVLRNLLYYHARKKQGEVEYDLIPFLIPSFSSTSSSTGNPG